MLIALFWQQCTQAVNNDGSVDAKRLMALVIETYRSYGRKHALFSLVLDNLPLGLSVFDVGTAPDRSATIRFRQLFGFCRKIRQSLEFLCGLYSHQDPTEKRGSWFDPLTKLQRRRTGRHAAAAKSKIRRREWLMDDGRIIFSAL